MPRNSYWGSVHPVRVSGSPIVGVDAGDELGAVLGAIRMSVMNRHTFDFGLSAIGVAATTRIRL